MTYIQEKVTSIGGLTSHLVQTDKFKTNTLLLQFRAPLEEATVTKRALLSYVLKSATAKSPTSQELQSRLDYLYGATLSSSLSKKGEQHIISFVMTIANERFLSNEQELLKQALSLLGELVFDPLVDEHAFDSKTVGKEKRALKARIQSIYDDKMRYASQRLIDEMCENEPFHLHTYGYENDLDSLTPVDLFEYYIKMINEDAVDLFMIGQIDEEKIIPELERIFPFTKRVEKLEGIQNQETTFPNQERVIKESQPIEQGKLNLGFRTNVRLGDPLYYASQVFNGLFGAFPHSKLFMNVREKNSLAYYCSSSYESFKGFIIVMSGIEFSNYEKARTIIIDQLSDIQNGAFSDHEMSLTKALLKNSILESLDNPFSIADILYQQVASGVKFTIEEFIDGIENVTTKEIVEVANQTKLDTTYFLQGAVKTN
ncbi:EF-P 5-aminopentanol modification-associated protein YfmF [Terrilactibacillus laevilacticus]|uniref:EF-P 5-aminopentanol modification-associated protein YfmF n=1 Tax=Terrilactibacillus laevilacticus TaxID=1380157 RepID=A0ABW5PPN6_9BACI|nr:pitrilysin family protein [Terrilactibacillus laevilacticus]